MGRTPESSGTLANLRLSRTALERAAERRSDPGLLPGLLRDPATRVLAIVDGSAEVVDRGEGLELALRPPLPSDAAALAVFLGLDADHAAYVAVDDDAAESTDARDLRTLRQVGTDLGDRGPADDGPGRPQLAPGAQPLPAVRRPDRAHPGRVAAPLPQ